MVKVQPANAPGNEHEERKRRLVALVAELFDLLHAPAVATATHPAYATKKCNPAGSARAFLTACQSGTFDTFRRGRELAARWEDVAAFIEGRVLSARKLEAKPREEDPHRRALEAAGVRLGPASETRRTGAQSGRSATRATPRLIPIASRTGAL